MPALFAFLRLRNSRKRRRRCHRTTKTSTDCPCTIQERTLANARRREVVAQLAGSVAHDFNNLLHVIAGNLELAEDCVRDDARDLIQRGKDAAEKGSGLTRRLVSLACKRPLKPESLSLTVRVE